MKQAIPLVFGCAAALTLLAAGALLADQTSDVLFKALQDELQRNSSQLQMENLERPYFICYTVDDYQNLDIRGTLGTLLDSKLERERYLTVDLRAGDYALDNSNFVSGFSGFGPHFYPITIDDNYDALRNKIYLATDEAYKDAVQILSKKKAYLQSRVIKDRPDDFLKQPANQFTDQPERFDLDKAYFEDLVITATQVFMNYPMIASSQLRLTASAGNQYLLNTAGTKATRGDRVYGVTLTMSGKSSEGEDIADGSRIVVRQFDQLPTKAQLVAWAKENAETMKNLVSADTLDEYVGPVILTRDAAGEFFRQLFVQHVSNSPSPTSDNDQFSSSFPQSEFANKIFRRVLPDFFNVYDDPTIDKLGNLNLIGKYEVDDAGNPPKRVQLVDKGRLVNLLIGTAPTKKIKEPNGHARGAVSKDVTAKPANMVFESNNKVGYEQLKKEMLSLCKDFDLPYGLVIRKLQDPNAPRTRFNPFGGQTGGRTGDLTVPLEVYKVYLDGREELARGLQFTSVSVRNLRDILRTDDQPYVYNFLVSDDYEMPASLVCPSILLEEMELKSQESKVRKPPILPSPLTEK